MNQIAGAGRWLWGLIVAALLLGIGTLYFIHSFAAGLFGVDVPGEVTRKTESIRFSGSGWSHDFSILVRYRVPGSSTSDSGITVDEEIFDRLRVGSPVTVRRLPTPLAALADNLFLPPKKKWSDQGIGSRPTGGNRRRGPL